MIRLVDKRATLSSLVTNPSEQGTAVAIDAPIHDTVESLESVQFLHGDWQTG